MAKTGNTTFEKIDIGTSATLSRTLSKTDIKVLGLVSGDANPFPMRSENDIEVLLDASATQ